eukprot:723720-Rhodomonas_salina.3
MSHLSLRTLRDLELVTGQGVKTADTPMEEGLAFTDADTPEEVNEEDREWYQSALSSIIFLLGWTRLDLGYTVSVFSRYANNPGLCHMAVMKWHGRKSRSGLVAFLNGWPVAWASKLQGLIALSTAEAEYVAACQCLRVAKYLVNVLEELGYMQPRQVPVFEDNEACIKMSEGTASSERTKHIDIKYHYVRDQVSGRFVKLEHVDSRSTTSQTSSRSPWDVRCSSG